MGLLDLPPELVEQILAKCDHRHIVRCKQVSRSFNAIIDGSAFLTYRVDLAVAGFDDTHLKQSLSTQYRRQLLADAQGIWRGSVPVQLVQMLDFAHLEYWHIRDGILLTKFGLTNPANDDDGAVTFDITRIPPEVGASTIADQWTLRFGRGTGSIACIDPAQDLIAVRLHKAATTGDAGTVEHWYRLAMYSLSTGKPHPRAQQKEIEFTMSRRVVKNPHYTRVAVLDNVMSVNMASGFQLFTETNFFDWTTGERKAAFCSPGAAARAWGHPAVMISNTCFLQPCFSSAERRPAIEVYVLDANPLVPKPEDGEPHPARHIATYWLPRIVNGDVRLIIHVTTRQQVSPSTNSSSPSSSLPADTGFLLSSAHARMVHVQITGVWFTSPFSCAFFTPTNQFLAEADRFLSLPAERRRWLIPRQRPWASWGNTTTRWLERDGPAWHAHAKSSVKGSGSRYVFPNHLIDFSPLDIAREVHQHHLSGEKKAVAFASTVEGWTVHSHAATRAMICGSEMFDPEEELVSSLPYRQKEIADLPQYEPGFDLLLLGDKIVSVEGGAMDVVRIYSQAPQVHGSPNAGEDADTGHEQQTRTDDI